MHFARCGATYGIDEVRVACDCGRLLDVVYDWDRLQPPTSLDCSKTNGRAATTRLLQRRLAIPRVAAVRPAGNGCHHRRRADAAATRDGVAKYVGCEPAGCSCSTRG